MYNGNTSVQDNGTKLDALLYFIRKYGTYLLVTLLSGLVLYFVFHFFASDLTASCLKVHRVESTTATEAVFSGMPQAEGEGFLNLNGTHILKNGKRVNCDLLMCRKDTEYKDNYFAFDIPLSEGECAVSSNLMASYGLRVGDKLSVDGESGDYVYTVKAATEATYGIDKSYDHAGVIIIGYNGGLLSEKSFSYLTFMNGADGIWDPQRIVILQKEREAAIPGIVSGLFLTVLFTALTVFLWELLIGRRSFSDLRRFAELGARPRDLYLRVLSLILLKYFLPLVAVALIWHGRLGCFGTSYVYPMLAVIFVDLLILAVYSILLFRRVSLCRMKKR